MNVKKILAGALALALGMGVLALPAAAEEQPQWVRLYSPDNPVVYEGFDSLNLAETDYPIPRNQSYFVTYFVTLGSVDFTISEFLQPLKNTVTAKGGHADWVTVFPATLEQALQVGDIVFNDIGDMKQFVYVITLRFTYADPNSGEKGMQNLSEALAPYWEPLDIAVLTACNEYNAQHGTALTVPEYWEREGWRRFGAAAEPQVPAGGALPAGGESPAAPPLTEADVLAAQRKNADYIAAVEEYQRQAAAREAAYLDALR